MSKGKRRRTEKKPLHTPSAKWRSGWAVPCHECGGRIEGYEGQDWGCCLQCNRVFKMVDLPTPETLWLFRERVV